MACKTAIFHVLLVTLLLWCQLSTVHAQDATLTGGGLVMENVGSTQVCVTLDSTPASEVNVTLETDDTPSGAQAGRDYESLNQVLTFTANTTILTQCVNITIFQDSAVENSVESFNVLANSMSISVSPASVNVIIQEDNDHPMTPRCVNITIVDDTAVDSSSKKFVQVTSALLATPCIVTIIILNDNDELTIGFEQSTYTTSEGNGTVTVCAEILEGSVQRSLTGVSFTFEAQGGTAADGSDYSLTMTMGTFQPGETRACTTITIIADTNVEGAEYFTVILTGSSEAIVSNTAGNATVIIDDANGVTLLLTTNSSLSVLEPGDSGSTTTGIEVCVMLDSTPGEIDRDIGVTLNTNAATADASDFQPLSEVLTIPSTTTVGTTVCQNITVTILGDTVEEGDESFTVTVSATSPNTITPTTAATVTILDDGDVANCPALSITNGVVTHPTTTLGAVATYTCDTGFQLTGNSNRTCQADSTWTATDPTCEVILRFCMLLESPMNGNVTFNTEFNSQATYTCDTGFDLLGNDIRTCQADRSWSGEEPFCSSGQRVGISLLLIFASILIAQLLL